MSKHSTGDAVSSLRSKLIGESSKKSHLVYIFNMSEDVWPFIAAMSDVKERDVEITENANLVDRELYSLAYESEFVFVSPRPIQPDFLEYFQELMNVKHVEVLVPSKHTGQICEDILVDHSVFHRLVELGKECQKFSVISYSTTPQFLKLVEQMKQSGVNVYTPESPENEDAWTVNFFGSKSGIRQLGQQSVAEEPDFSVPDGLICVGIDDAARIAANKYVKKGGVVLKTNKGHSGAGVLIFRPGDLPDDYTTCEKAICDILKKDRYWDLFPIVIEDLVNVNTAVGGGFPNVEFKIRKSGEIEFLYFCGMRMSSKGVFGGVEINKDVVTDRQEARMIDTGFFIGEKYAAAGYRGYFDVDFIAAKNGEIYVSESNVRRTGGTYAYEMTEELIGEDFLTESYVLSNSNMRLKPGKYTFAQVRELLKPLLFNKKTKEGLVIASANLLSQPGLAYVIFGKSKKKALNLEEKMKSLLGVE
jgi:hypothetical protein